jgi:hypothetical protein
MADKDQPQDRDDVLRRMLKTPPTSRSASEKRRVVEKFTDVDLDKDTGEQTWFQKMSELYELARRTALGSDQVLREIIARLERRS